MSSGAKRKSLQRLRVFQGLWGCIFLILVGRLIQLTVINRDSYARWALQQHQRIVELPPDRGSIYDRTGELLAISIDTDSIFASPADLEPDAVPQLASVLDRPVEELEKLLDRRKNFVWLARQVDPETARKVHELGLGGIRFLKESKRFYPKRQTASQLLGFLDLDGKGSEGLEQSFDSQLRGMPGRVMTEVDARQRTLSARERILQAKTSGKDLVLTLDHVIQQIAERELLAQVQAQKAESGIAIVLDPKLGDVLAIAHVPSFDPNRLRQSSADQRRERAFTDPFEPGSTLKPFIVASCLDQGTCRAEELIDCEMGAYHLGGRTIEDHTPHGLLTLAEVLKYSSNIGMTKLATRLGKDRLYEGLRAFHFGMKLTSFQQESPGRFRPPTKWSGTSVSAVAMGYEILVTPLQLAAAYGAIANDGLLVQPRFVLSPEGLQPPEALGRILTEQTAHKMRTLLQDVVEDGTATSAKLEGLSSAGKTGTTKKLDPRTGRYSPTLVRATFVGMVPAEEPQLVILVMLDDPKVNPWGGLAAAPVFKRIAELSMAYLKMPRKRALDRDLLPAQPLLLEPRKPMGAPLTEPRQLVGLSLREALREADRAGWLIRTEGTGYAQTIVEERPSEGNERIFLVHFSPLALLPSPTPTPEPALTPVPSRTP